MCKNICTITQPIRFFQIGTIPNFSDAQTYDNFFLQRANFIWKLNILGVYQEIDNPFGYNIISANQKTGHDPIHIN